jgi:hypothetical protein
LSTVESLLVGSESGVVDVTVAVLVTETVSFGSIFRRSASGTLAPAARSPSAQVTVPPASVQGASAETKDRLAGSASSTVTPVESDGPLLVTSSV